MKKQEVLKYLDNNKKPILIGLAAIVVLIIVVHYTKKLIKNLESKRRQKKVEEDTGSSLTPGVDHRSLGEQIYEACLGTGTDEDAIYDSLRQLKTQADWELVKLEYESARGADKKWYYFGRLYLPNTLVACLRSDLDSSELARCRNILTTNGINPGF